MAKIYENLARSLDRAEVMIRELSGEYDKCLTQKSVSVDAVEKTHEVCEKLRGILDRTARRYWEIHIAPNLSPNDREDAAVYFPITSSQGGFDSCLGRWKWKSVRAAHQPLYEYLLALQPFSDGSNRWLDLISELAIASKHIDFIAQKRFEQPRITVSSNGGGPVSYDPNRVHFGSGVRLAGAPVDPRTQRIFPTPGVTERVELWVSFLIDGPNIDPMALCNEGCAKTRLIVTEMTEKFGLS